MVAAAGLTGLLVRGRARLPPLPGSELAHRRARPGGTADVVIEHVGPDAELPDEVLSFSTRERTHWLTW